jgi:hypothetical protein
VSIQLETLRRHLDDSMATNVATLVVRCTDHASFDPGRMVDHVRFVVDAPDAMPGADQGRAQVVRL